MDAKTLKFLFIHRLQDSGYKGYVEAWIQVSLMKSLEKMGHSISIMSNYFMTTDDLKYAIDVQSPDAIIIGVETQELPIFMGKAIKIDIPKVIFIQDCFTWMNQYIKLINDWNIDLALFWHYSYCIPLFQEGKGWDLPRNYIRKVAFSEYNKTNYQTIPPHNPPQPVSCQMKVFPFWIDPEVYKNFSYNRTIDVTFTGACRADIYPLRAQIVAELPDMHVRSEIHPNKRIPVSEYVELMNKSKIGIFDNQIFHIGTCRIPEIMACGSLVMMDRLDEDKDAYKFIPDENYVEVDQTNFKKKILYYLEHEDERRDIAHKGYETVMRHHTADVRAQQLITYIRNL